MGEITDECAKYDWGQDGRCHNIWRNCPKKQGPKNSRELAKLVFDGIATRVDQFFKAKNIQGGVRSGADIFSMVDEISLARSIECYAELRYSMLVRASKNAAIDLFGTPDGDALNKALSDLTQGISL